MLSENRCIVTTDLNFRPENARAPLQILFLPKTAVSANQIEKVRLQWQSLGVTHVRLSSDLKMDLSFPSVQAAYAVYNNLKRENFQTIQFCDQEGLAYYCILAKRLGLCFEQTDIKLSYYQESGYPRSDDEIIQRFLLKESIGLQSKKTMAASTQKPLISICMVACDRPHFLEKALLSLEKQTYKNFELILADNSIHPSQHDFAGFSFSVKTVISQNKTPGAARNLAASESSGEYLMFMDDDNIACSNELEIFLKASQNSTADIFTCAQQLFSEETQLRATSELLTWVPVGPLLPLGTRYNVFGDTNFFIRKESFVKAGGFRSENFYGEDWEFLSRAVLLGLQLEVVPERLYFYRQHSGNLTKRLIDRADQHLRLSPYLNHLPPEIAQYVQVMAAETSLGKISHRLVEKPIYYSSKIFSGSELSAKIKRINNITGSVDNTVFTATATGDDPWFEFELPAGMNGPIEIDIWMNLTERQYIQLFWRENSSADFQEYTSQTTTIADGLRRVRLQINDPQRSGSLRLDLEKSNAVAHIHSVVIKGLLSSQEMTPRRLDFKLKEFKTISSDLDPGFYCAGEKLVLSDFEIHDLEITDDAHSIRLTSTSVDPQMIIKDFAKYKIQRALVSYQIEAEDNFQFRVFWATSTDKNFSESKVTAVSLGKGKHSGQILIDSEEMIERLRIDPLESLGSFKLYCVSVESL